MNLSYAILPNNKQRFLSPFGATKSKTKFLAEGSFTFPAKSMRNLPFLRIGLAVSSSINLDFSFLYKTASRLFLKLGLTEGLSLVTEKFLGPLKPMIFFSYEMTNFKLSIWSLAENNRNSVPMKLAYSLPW